MVLYYNLLSPKHPRLLHCSTAKAMFITHNHFLTWDVCFVSLMSSLFLFFFLLFYLPLCLRKRQCSVCVLYLSFSVKLETTTLSLACVKLLYFRIRLTADMTIIQSHRIYQLSANGTSINTRNELSKKPKIYDTKWQSVKLDSYTIVNVCPVT